MDHLAHFFLRLVDTTGYAGLFVVMVLGNIGVPAGTELVLPAAGALAAKGHLPNVWIGAGVATFGEVAGGTILYMLGYYGGRPFVVRWGRYLRLNEPKLDAFHAFYERYGNAVVFVCRFVPGVRGIAGLPAGVSRMQKRYFWIFTFLGSLMYCTGLMLLGNTLGHHATESVAALRHFALALTAALLAAALLALVVRRRVVQRSRRELA
jgi:membrane protein DedA with SNARE-associated domain